MQLTQGQLDKYRADGYVMVPGLIPAAELRSLQQRLLEIIDGEHDWPLDHFQVLDPERFHNARGDLLPWGVQTPSAREATFSAIADHANLQAAMSQLIGGSVRRFTDQCILRNGIVRGGNSFYHQDSYYWRLAPELGCNAWITLHDVGPESGALAIKPRTQRDWTLVEHEDYYDDPTIHNARTRKAFMRHRIPTEKIDFSNEDVLEMQPGDAVFFTNYTWHRSERNMTGEHRFAYAIAYQLEQPSSN